jgi:hypothetical protein
MNRPLLLVCATILVAAGVARLPPMSAQSPKPDPKSATPKAEPVNLVRNGDFESGTLSPDHWQTVDGLSTFYHRDSDPKRNRCIRFDTDILQSQGYEWWAKFAKAESLREVLTTLGYGWWAERIEQPLAKNAPEKLPTVEPKYDTLAGLDGVWYWSDYIPVEKGAAYWLTLDAKGAGMMVWLVGYPEKGPTAFGSEAKALQGYVRELALPKNMPQKRGHDAIIARYIWRGQLSVAGSAGWQTFSRREKPFRPTSVTPAVRWVRVLVLPFWPPGEYYLDNVRLVEVPDPEKKKDDD